MPDAAKGPISVASLATAVALLLAPVAGLRPALGEGIGGSAPQSVRNLVIAWGDSCLAQGLIPNADPDFAAPVDIDGDGDLDWVTDASKLRCLNGHGETERGGPMEAGATFGIHVTLRDGSTRYSELFLVRGAIYNRGGHPILDVELPDGPAVFDLKEGELVRLKSMPAGGVLAYSFPR